MEHIIYFFICCDSFCRRNWLHGVAQVFILVVIVAITTWSAAVSSKKSKGVVAIGTQKIWARIARVDKDDTKQDFKNNTSHNGALRIAVRGYSILLFWQFFSLF